MLVYFRVSILLIFLNMTLIESCRPFLRIWDTKSTVEDDHIVEQVEEITTLSSIDSTIKTVPPKERIPLFHHFGSQCPPELDKHFCENNGTCVAIFQSEARFLLECNCKKGFGGYRCLDKEINVLTDNSDNSHQVQTTLNDLTKNEIGTIVTDNRLKDDINLSIASLQGHEFQCPPQYAENYCLHNGTCKILLRERTQNILDYSCQCKEIYIGTRCQFKQAEFEVTPPQIRLRRGLNRFKKSPNFQKRATQGRKIKPKIPRNNKFLVTQTLI